MITLNKDSINKIFIIFAKKPFPWDDNIQLRPEHITFIPVASPHSTSSRSQSATPPLHPYEKTLLGFALASLAFVAWGGGGMYGWVQIIVGILALATFTVAMLTREVTPENHSQKAALVKAWPKLRGFPFFWLGLIYFAYIVIQQCNPAWEHLILPTSKRLIPLDFISWLPHGVAGTRFYPMNAWRTLLIEASIWLLVCAIAIGLTRRKSYRILLTGLAVNGALIAGAILLQRITGTEKLLGIWDSPASYFAGPFIYKNHAGSYLDLVIALCLGVAWWFGHRAERRQKKSHPGILYIFISVLVMFALALTYARAATAFGLGLMLIAMACWVAANFISRPSKPWGALVIMILLSVWFIGVCAYSLKTGSVVDRFERLFKEDKVDSINSRQMSTQATLDMAADNLVLGHGIGGFRYIFPIYQRAYPSISTTLAWNGKKNVPVGFYWEHAHDDYAELLAEGGLALILLFVGGGFVWIYQFVHCRGYRQPTFMLFVGGPIVVAINAFFDFPAHNPAVLMTSLVILTAVLRWAQLDAQRTARRSVGA